MSPQVHSVTTSILSRANLGLHKLEESVVISGSCLDKNISAMYSLLRQFMTETNWDNEKKLESLIKNNASGVVNSIASAGSQFAESYSSSKLTASKVVSPSINLIHRPYLS
jgi:Zn-dependent M16 (insulinase) family peptidase